MNGRIDPKTCNYPTPTNGEVNGGTFGMVSPVLKGQYSDEIVAGIQYDVGLDIVLGASYIHRDLGRVIEDVSTDGGNNYIIANPGECYRHGARSAGPPEGDRRRTERSDEEGRPAADQLRAVPGHRSFSTSRSATTTRSSLTLTKRLSHNFLRAGLVHVLAHDR